MLHAAVTSLEHTCLSKYYALKLPFVYSMVVASFRLSIAAAINQIDVDSRKTRKQPFQWHRRCGRSWIIWVITSQVHYLECNWRRRFFAPHWQRTRWCVRYGESPSLAFPHLVILNKSSFFYLTEPYAASARISLHVCGVKALWRALFCGASHISAWNPPRCGCPVANCVVNLS